MGRTLLLGNARAACPCWGAARHSSSQISTPEDAKLAALSTPAAYPSATGRRTQVRHPPAVLDPCALGRPTAKQWECESRGSMPRNRNGTPEATPPVLVRGLTWQRMSSSGSGGLSRAFSNNGEEATTPGFPSAVRICKQGTRPPQRTGADSITAREQRVDQSRCAVHNIALGFCWSGRGTRRAGQPPRSHAQGRTSNRRALAPPRAPPVLPA